MDAFNDPLVEIVVMMFSTQTGKTECFFNVIGYHIDHDPAPIILMEPTLSLAEAISKDRIAPMIRDTPSLRAKVSAVKSRDKNNTIRHKTFEGGHLTLIGANSTADTASRPVRIVLIDEPDRHPMSVGREGNSSAIIIKRAANFWNRKIGIVGSPTIKGASAIEDHHKLSDQRKCYIPCVHCGEWQLLKWSNVRWPGPDKSGVLYTPVYRPEEAFYECESKGCNMSDVDINRQVAYHEWRADKDFNGIAGFWLWEIYSPWTTMRGIVRTFLEARRKFKEDHDPEPMKTFVNTTLAETWATEADRIDGSDLLHRREAYGPAIVMMAGFLTCSVDVQDGWLSAGVVAWGIGKESWRVERKVFRGNLARPEAWNDLAVFLDKIYKHESDADMPITCTTIDTGGHHTQEVYAFVKEQSKVRRIYGCKGANTPGKPIVSTPAKSKTTEIKLITVGSDTGKEWIYSHTKITDPGPGCMHYPMNYPQEYFDELTAEEVITKKVRGVPQRVWICPPGKRNEALDIEVLNLAALELANPDLPAYVAFMQAGGAAAKPRRGRRVLNKGIE